MIRFICLLALVGIASGCATLVNGDRQLVNFKGGPEQGTTKVIAPDGTFDLVNGTGAFMVTRSKSDIPVRVICPDGSTKNAIIYTRWSWLPGVFGNLANGGWGWLIDPFTNQAYEVEDFTLAEHCPQRGSEGIAH